MLGTRPVHGTGRTKVEQAGGAGSCEPGKPERGVLAFCGEAQQGSGLIEAVL